MKQLTAKLVAMAFGVLMIAAFSFQPLHFGLAKSLPEAGASVASPDALQLWFTQVPQDGSVSIRLIDGDGELVETGDPTPDEEDAKKIVVALDGELSAGAYTVAWRGIGDDGHVVRDDFSFSVSAR